MDFWLGLLLGVVVVLLVGALLSRRATRGTDPTQLTFDPAVMTQAKNLALNDQKIAAIQLLRDSTPGLSLAAAKALVDKLGRRQPSAPFAGEPIPPTAVAAPPAAPPGPADWYPAAAADVAPSTSRLPLEVELEARSLKSQGKAINAIKLVREHTDLSLLEAKNLVDGL